VYYKQIKGGKWRAYQDVGGRTQQVKSCCKAARDGDSLICYGEIGSPLYHCLTHNSQGWTDPVKPLWKAEQAIAEIKPQLDKVRPCVASPEALKQGLPIVDLGPHFKAMRGDIVIRVSPTGVYSETTRAAIKQARLDSPRAISSYIHAVATAAQLSAIVAAIVYLAYIITGSV
jgi:hypothetical protein